MSNKILGLDVALNNFGYYLDEEHRGCWYNVNDLRGVARLSALKKALESFLDSLPYKVERAAIEGYSFGYSKKRVGKGTYVSARNNLSQLGESGGIVRVVLFERGIDYVSISPAELKSCFSGDRSASKEDMMLAAKRLYKRDFTDNNECDAFALHVIGNNYWKDYDNGVQDILVNS